MYNRITFIIVFFFICLPHVTHAEKLNVLASFSIIADFAKNVGGEHITLKTLNKDNTDPHSYEPSPKEGLFIKKADIILINGLGFESHMENFIEAIAEPKKIIRLTDGINPLYTKEKHSHHGHRHGHDHDHDHDPHKEKQEHSHKKIKDPHAFQSIENAKIYIRNIAKTFCEADQEKCNNYRINAANYIAKLDQLDQEIKSIVQSIPPSHRVVATSHNAFSYLGKAYGISFFSIKGLSTETEESARDLAKIVRLVRKKKIKAIFFESLEDHRLISRITDETGLQPKGTLYAENLSTTNEKANTYIDMMRYNILTIKEAIVGK